MSSACEIDLKWTLGYTLDRGKFMNPILKELTGIEGKKHIVTSIEYDTPTEKSQDVVFDSVRDILSNGLDHFSKITFDVEPDGSKVKVEVTENKM